MRRLCDVRWFAGVYCSIYDIVALEGRLPPPSRVFILDGPGEVGALVPKHVAGFAIPERRAIWFRIEPPHPWVFAHELIHIAWKRLCAPEEEEVYGYLLPRLILLMAERGLTPPANPLRLFEEVDTVLLERALRSTLGISLAELYERLGLPHPARDWARLESIVGRRLASDKLYVERAATIASLFDIACAARRYPELLKVVLWLLKELAELDRRRRSSAARDLGTNAAESPVSCPGQFKLRATSVASCRRHW